MTEGLFSAHLRRLETHNNRLKPGQPVKKRASQELCHGRKLIPWMYLGTKPLYDMGLSRWTETGDILDTWIFLAKSSG
jgi:hypothetical protein